MEAYCDNKYVQGSVWRWVGCIGEQSAERTAGSGCDVLVISGNAVNACGDFLSCVLITPVMDENAGHTQLFVGEASRLSFDKIYRIPKTELTEYRGMIYENGLAEVKAGLKRQFELEDDCCSDLLTDMKKNLDELNYSVRKFMFEFNYIETFAAKKNPDPYVMALSDLELREETGRIVKKRRRYSDEDKLFIANRNNSIDSVMEKYDLSRKAAYRTRAFFREKLKA